MADLNSCLPPFLTGSQASVPFFSDQSPATTSAFTSAFEQVNAGVIRQVDCSSLLRPRRHALLSQLAAMISRHFWAGLPKVARTIR